MDHSYFFDIAIGWNEMDERDVRNFLYVQKNIHTLPLDVPPSTKSFHINKLENIVSDFYQRVRRRNDSAMAYKGGHFARDLLEKLRIPFVNVESFGGPKAEHLFDALVWLETCGNIRMHINIVPKSHCSISEACSSHSRRLMRMTIKSMSIHVHP